MTTQPATEDRATQRRRRLQRYTTWVERLCAQDPGARSALRTGLRRDLDDVRRMHRFVTPWLPENRPVEDTEQRAYYAIAAMIAAQPRNRYVQAETADESTEEDGADGLADAAAENGRRPERYGESLGRAFAAAVTQVPGRDKEMRKATAEARLNLLTRQSVDGLHRHLPAAVGYLRGLDVPVDWAQLLYDVVAWPVHSGRIARRWLQDYYRLTTEATRLEADLADRRDAEDPAPAP